MRVIYCVMFLLTVNIIYLTDQLAITKHRCLLNVSCWTKYIIYEATVESIDNKEKYTWKQRNYAGKTYTTNSKHVNSTTLSKQIWKFKNKNQNTQKVT